MNRYGESKRVMVHSGQFERCRHGHTFLSDTPCLRCGIWHPLKFAAHLFRYFAS